MRMQSNAVCSTRNGYDILVVRFGEIQIEVAGSELSESRNSEAVFVGKVDQSGKRPVLSAVHLSENKRIISEHVKDDGNGHISRRSTCHRGIFNGKLHDGATRADRRNQVIINDRIACFVSVKYRRNFYDIVDGIFVGLRTERKRTARRIFDKVGRNDANLRIACGFFLDARRDIIGRRSRRIAFFDVGITAVVNSHVLIFTRIIELYGHSAVIFLVSRSSRDEINSLIKSNARLISFLIHKLESQIMRTRPKSGVYVCLVEAYFYGNNGIGQTVRTARNSYIRAADNLAYCRIGYDEIGNVAKKPFLRIIYCFVQKRGSAFERIERHTRTVTKGLVHYSVVTVERKDIILIVYKLDTSVTCGLTAVCGRLDILVEIDVRKRKACTGCGRKRGIYSETNIYRDLFGQIVIKSQIGKYDGNIRIGIALIFLCLENQLSVQIAGLACTRNIEIFSERIVYSGARKQTEVVVIVRIAIFDIVFLGISLQKRRRIYSTPSISQIIVSDNGRQGIFRASRSVLAVDVKRHVESKSRVAVRRICGISSVGERKIGFCI